MSDKMLVTQALDERDLLVKKISDKIAKASFVDTIKPNEDKVANWGDHYQFVATKSVLARAVSKERLTKRGLVSLSDYYLKVVHI